MKRVLFKFLSLLFVVALSCLFASAHASDNSVIKQALLDVKRNWPLLDFVQGYDMVSTTLKDNTANVTQVVCSLYDMDREIVEKKIKAIMSTKDCVKALAYNMDNRNPGFLQNLVGNGLSMELTMEVANSSLSCTQTLDVAELGKLLAESPSDINLYNVESNVRVRSLLKDDLPSVAAAYSVVRSYNGYTDNENTTGTITLKSGSVEKGKYVYNFLVSDELMQEFEFRGKSKVKSAFGSLNFETRSVPYFEHPQLLRNVGIKSILFRFQSQKSKKYMEISYDGNGYETFYNNQVIGKPKQYEDVPLVSLPQLIDRHCLLAKVSPGKQILSYTFILDAQMSAFVRDNADFRDSMTKHLLRAVFAKSLIPETNFIHERSIAICLSGIGLYYVKDLSYNQIAKILCQNANDYAALEGEIKRTMASMPVNSLNPAVSDIEIQPIATGERQKVNGIVKTEKDGRLYHITTNIEYTTPSPAFENLCKRFLFNDDTHGTLKDAVLAYFKSYDKTSGEKKSEWDECYMSSKSDRFLTYRVRIVNTRPGFYTNYKLWYVDEQKKGGKFDKVTTDTLEVVYDATKDRILTIEDILSTETALEVKALAGDEPIRISAKPFSVVYAFKKDEKLYSKELYYYLDENLFTPYFLKLIDWDKTCDTLQQ